jgi:enamine deaminase RidA (YjgF/YER057c/UK114 family)
MTIKRIECGPRMSQAVIYNGMAYLAGQVARGDATATTVTAQTKIVLAQIDRLLAEAGTSKQNLLTASIWLSNMDTFGEMNAVWDQWVAAGCSPARATVEARLASPSLLVEIAVTAAIP